MKNFMLWWNLNNRFLHNIKWDFIINNITTTVQISSSLTLQWQLKWVLIGKSQNWDYKNNRFLHNMKWDFIIDKLQQQFRFHYRNKKKKKKSKWVLIDKSKKWDYNFTRTIAFNFNNITHAHYLIASSGDRRSTINTWFALLQVCVVVV